MESYIFEELNIRKLTLTSEEDIYGVLYKLEPDHKELGQKLKKDFGKVKAALTKLTHADAKLFVKDGSINVAGITLGADDLRIVRYVDNSASMYEVHFDTSVIALLDTTLDANLINESLAREMMNRVQRMRKKAGLVATDSVQYNYILVDDVEKELSVAFQEMNLFLQKGLKQDLILGTPTNSFIEEEHEIGSSKLKLYFSR